MKKAFTIAGVVGAIGVCGIVVGVVMKKRGVR